MRCYGVGALPFRAVAKDPDPSLELTTIKGTTRTIDDWTTSFHLALVVLPGRPEAAAYVRIGQRIAATLGGSDCRPGFLIIGNERAAQRVMGNAVNDQLTFLDPDGLAAKGLGIERTPSFTYVRLNGTVVSADGWDPAAWRGVLDQLAKEMAWTKPLMPAPGDPPPFAGWST